MNGMRAVDVSKFRIKHVVTIAEAESWLVETIRPRGEKRNAAESRRLPHLVERRIRKPEDAGAPDRHIDGHVADRGHHGEADIVGGIAQPDGVCDALSRVDWSALRARTSAGDEQRHRDRDRKDRPRSEAIHAASILRLTRRDRSGATLFRTGNEAAEARPSASGAKWAWRGAGIPAIQGGCMGVIRSSAALMVCGGLALLGAGMAPLGAKAPSTGAAQGTAPAAAQQPTCGGRSSNPQTACPEDVEKMMAALPDKAPAKPAKPRKVLVLAKAAGFVHASIPVAAKTVEELGKKTGAWSATTTYDPA